MNLRGLYRGAGVCAMGFAIIALVSYCAWIASNGFLAVGSTPPSGEELHQMTQARGNILAVRLELLAYFLLVPALLGLYLFLENRAPGRARIGAAFAVFGFVANFISYSLNLALFQIAQAPATEILKERLALLHQISMASFIPGLQAFALSNLLWGLAFRLQEGLARLVGNLFLAQVVGFLIAAAGFGIRWDVVGNAGILVQVLSLVATYATAAKLLGDESRSMMGPTLPDKPKAAAAGAG
ncbi:MAG: hypothetical protein AB1898_14430 [Acidobacteriota bacterium]